MRYMKAFAMAIMLALVTGCASSQAANDKPVVQGVPASASIAGTTWAGTDSDGDFFAYYFQKDGALHYKVPSGVWRNGTWRQEGNKVYIETNNGYAELQGVISGNRIEGTARNIKGHQWTWVGKKE